MKQETLDLLHKVIKEILESEAGDSSLYVAEYMDLAGGETRYSDFDFLINYDERLKDLIWHLENNGFAIYKKTKEGMKIIWENNID